MQTAKAIDYLHRSQVVHFDIKLENMYVHRGAIKLGKSGTCIILTTNVLHIKPQERERGG